MSGTVYETVVERGIVLETTDAERAETWARSGLRVTAHTT
jgi:hypothetical protein